MLLGYVHFVFILDPKDCLQHVTERPLPSDVILQVETFTNSTFLWNERELTLLKVYRSISEENYSPYPSDDENIHGNYWYEYSVAAGDHLLDIAETIYSMFGIQNPHSNPVVHDSSLHSDEPTVGEVQSSDAVASNKDYAWTSEKHKDDVKESASSGAVQSQGYAAFMESHALYDLFDVYRK